MISTTTPTPDFFMFIGHSHPLLVHLPIGFLVLLVVIELLAKRPHFQNLRDASGLILLLALLSSTFSAACGWLLAGKGGYDPSLIIIHRWSGVGVAISCLVTLVFYWRHWTWLYNFGLFATFGLVVVAGHYGGSLTHGSDYLTQNLPVSVRQLLGEPTPRPVITNPEQAVAFADVVQPILNAKCAACHGTEKQKGKLRLDSIAGIRQGCENGTVIVPGDAAKSQLLSLVMLPVDNKDHMPPAGKPQLSDEEITLIRWWVDTGASADKKIADLKPTARAYAALYKMLGTSETVTPPKPLEEISPLAIQLAGDLGIRVQLIADKEPWLEVNASLLGTKFTDTELARLAPLAGNVRWLDIGGTSVTDTGLMQLADMPHLVRLDLHQTALTDAGLAKLKPLHHLEYLNLYGTGITDNALPHLKRLINLRRLYLWKTKITPEAGKALAEELADKDRITRLENNITQLQKEISHAQVTVNLGTNPSTNTVPKSINNICPVSGKPVDPSKTFLYKGKLIAFCCGNCCAEFQKAPNKYLAKLKLEQP